MDYPSGLRCWLCYSIHPPGPWLAKRRPQPRANAPPVQIHLDYSDSQIPSFENDVHKDPDYPIETYAPCFLNCQSDSVGRVYPDLAKILATPKHFSRREAPPRLPSHPSQSPAQPDNPRSPYIVAYFFDTQPHFSYTSPIKKRVLITLLITYH